MEEHSTGKYERMRKMAKLVYGKLGQVSFNSEEEKEEAIQYILTSDNVDYDVHEDNQNQGAWAPEERIHFKSEDGVPDSLKRNMTAGNGSIYGRINCKEFCEEIRNRANK